MRNHHKKPELDAIILDEPALVQENHPKLLVKTFQNYIEEQLVAKINLFGQNLKRIDITFMNEYWHLKMELFMLIVTILTGKREESVWFWYALTGFGTVLSFSAERKLCGFPEVTHIYKKFTYNCSPLEHISSLLFDTFLFLFT